MKNKENSIKKNLSSLQVLKTFKILIDNEYTMNELILKLNSNESFPIFNNSVISKYINTCRYCGIKIPKINNKYIIASIPFGINVESSDISIIEEIQFIADKILSDRYSINFKDFLKYLFKFLNINLNNMNDFYKKSSIKLLHYENEATKVNNTVIFKIKGELIKKYDLRENEYIMEEDLPNYITIVNKDEDKDALFSRLFRYAEFCEIEHPKFYREEIKEILKNALENYGEEVYEE